MCGAAPVKLNAEKGKRGRWTATGNTPAGTTVTIKATDADDALAQAGDALILQHAEDEGAKILRKAYAAAAELRDQATVKVEKRQKDRTPDPEPTTKTGTVLL